MPQINVCAYLPYAPSTFSEQPMVFKEPQHSYAQAQAQILILQTQLHEARARIQQLEASAPHSRVLAIIDSELKQDGPSHSHKTTDADIYSDVPAYMSPLPIARESSLSSLPAIVVSPEDAGSSLFSRKDLSDLLGGGPQSLIVGCMLTIHRCTYLLLTSVKH